jgi:putative redox protein
MHHKAAQEKTMETSVNYLGGLRFEVNTREHRITTDQPLENGGADTGMTPPELLLASLGTCAGHYAAEYLRARSLPTEGLQVHVQAEKALSPARLSMFRIRVDVPNVDSTHRVSLLRTVKHCLIHNTLLRPASIDVDVETGARADAA